MVDPTRPAQSLFGSDRLPGIGTRLGSFEVGERIGSGSVGVVHRGTDHETGIPVAIKLLRPQWAIHSELFEGFLNRARELQKVEHLNVAEITDLGVHDEDIPYLVMEFVPGGDLGASLNARARPMPFDQVMAIADQICGGVAAMHGADFIHGDLKPSDVLLARGQRVVVHDFSLLAEAIEAGVGMSLCRNITYLAPEVRASANLSPRADVYSIGRIVAHMLLGDAPATVTETALRRARPELPGHVLDAVVTALERDPARRQASAAALRHDLKRDSVRPSAPRDSAIMVVDDDPEFLEWVAATLSEAIDGVSIETHDNVDDALLHLGSGGYSMVLTDLNMPGRDGAYLTRQVHEREPYLPVIVVTGVGAASHWRKLKADGARACMLKPVDAATLIAVVTAHLR